MSNQSDASASGSSSTATILSKISGATYTIFTSKPPLPSDSAFSFPQGTSGYVIADLNGKITVTQLGEAQKPRDIFGKRQIACQVSRDGICSLNGAEYKSVFLPDSIGATYVQEPECFITVDGDQVIIAMATDGYYCVDYKFLYCVKGVKLNASIQVKSDSTGQRFVQLPPDCTKIFHAGRQEPIGNIKTNPNTTNMLMADANIPGKVLIDRDAKVRELFYLEMADGSFTNVELDSFLIPSVALSANYSGVYDILQGYRCEALQPFKASQASGSTTETISLDVTRFNRQTVKVKIDLYRMGANQEKAYDVHLEAKHPNEENIIDFGSETFITSVNGEPCTKMTFTKWHTKLLCQFVDGESGEIHIYRDVLQYSEVAAPMKRYENDKPLASESSNAVYMVDDKVYSQSTRDDKFSADFDGKNLILRPRKGVSSYATYNGDGIWTKTSLRSKIAFDSEYTYCITTVTAGKIEVPMKSFGDYDARDLFMFTADGSELKKNVYKVKPDTNTQPEALIASVKFVAIDEGKISYPFVVNFIFKDFSRVSFLISDDPDFQAPYFRRTSFNGAVAFAPFWTYGAFIGQPNRPMNAFGNLVVNGSLDSNVYPVISFNDAGAGTVNKTNGSLEILTRVLEEDLVIPVAPSDEYVRLNGCASVSYTGSALTIPKNSSVSFFRIGSKIYLLRSPLTRAVSFNGSPSSSPKSESIVPPAPSPAVSPRAAAVLAPVARPQAKVVAQVAPSPLPAARPALASAPAPALAQRVVGAVTRAIPAVVARQVVDGDVKNVSVRAVIELRSDRLHA